MQRTIEIEPFLDNRYPHVGSDGNPYLTLDGVLRGAEEALDAKVLLDPLEKQSHLPRVL